MDKNALIGDSKFQGNLLSCHDKNIKISLKNIQNWFECHKEIINKMVKRK